MRIAMWMLSSEFGVVIFFFCSIFTEDINAVILLQSNITMPSQGSSLRLSCLLLDIELNNNKVTWKRPNDFNQYLSQCERKSGFCLNFNSGYVFTANSSGSYVDIISLNRSQHDGMWKCIYDASVGPDIEGSFSLVVYTLAQGLNFIQEPGLSTDLSMTTVTLRCRTTSCIYPTPAIKWLYKDAHNPDERRVYKITVTEATRENCESPENFYSSSLELPLYTTWPDNSDITVTFSCGIEYLDFSRNIYSLDSKPVTFAVGVTWTQMQHNGQAISDTTLTVTSGEATTLTCVTGTSRPPATIDWYIGSQKRGNGTSLNFIAVNDDNEKMIYCQAYNTDPQQPVQSTQRKLFVRVRVTEVVLQMDGQAVIDQTLTVTSGSATTLTCVTGTSRPPATIDWYIGSQKRGNGTSLNFIAVNDDNEKMIYCQAYNTDPQQPVQSTQLKLFVRVNVTEVTLTPYGNGTVIFYEGVSKILSCTSSPSRPVPTIRWWLGNKQVTDNIIILNTTDASQLLVQTSNVTLVMVRDRRNQTISCDGSIIGQIHPATSRPLTIDVWYAPDINVTIDGLTRENISSSVICEVKGVPAKYVFHPWKHMFGDIVIRSDLSGTPIGSSSSHNTLLLERLSLQDMGTYICSADNGIKGINGDVIQTGNVDLKVTGAPHLIKEDKNLFAEAVGHSINISIYFYSHPAIMDFHFLRNDTPVMNNSKTSTNLSNDTVDYEFYDKPVKLEAHLAHLYIQNLTLHDFGTYTLVLENSLGRRTLRIQLDASGPPQMINRFFFSQFIEDQIELNFEPGFNGGRIQTFVIEYMSAADPDNWINSSISDLKETYIRLRNGTCVVKITQPSPGNYTYRMYSWNDIGRSPYSAVITVIIPDVNKQQGQAGSSVAAIAGGIGAFVLVIAVVSVVLIIIRRSKLNDEEQKRKFLMQERPVTGLKENPVYDMSESGPVVQEYAAVVKPKRVFGHAEDPSKLYAQVDKTNKNKCKVASKEKPGKISKASKGKHVKTSRGDVYENNPLPLKSSVEDVYENPGHLATDHNSSENVYENPEMSASKCQLVNKDGLLYADMILGPPTTKAGKPIIHGLETQTEYAEIDYGKRGEPIPESD